MRLYVALWRANFQESIQYRAEALVWTLYDVLPPIMMAFVWLAAYEGQETIAGYSLGAMLLYTVGVMFLRAAITTHPENDIDRQIRMGELSMRLVRPLSPWAYWFVDALAWRTMRAIIVVPILVGVVLWLLPYFPDAPLRVERLSTVILSVALGFLLCYALKLCVGFLCFWLTDVQGIVTLFEVLAAVFGGVIVPLDLLPEPLRALGALLPFQYIYYVPLSALLGRLDGTTLWVALTIQLVWVASATLLAYAIWCRGLRRYEAVGG